MKKTFALAIVAVLTTAPMVAFAQPVGRDGDAAPTARRVQNLQSQFDQADANGDGLLSPNEASRMNHHKFDRLDADGDGFLTVEEMANPRGANA